MAVGGGSRSVRWEELRAASQSLLPAEQSVIRGIMAQAARAQYTQEMSEEAEEVVC